MRAGSRQDGFAASRAGSVAPLVAIVFTTVLGFSAVSIDVGNWFVVKRRQQTASDLAAIAAASDLPNARRAAAATLALNGFSDTEITSFETGLYSADPALPASRRFTSTTGTPNAVRLGLLHAVPSMMARLLGPSATGFTNGQASIATAAVAARADFAAFAIGSRVASLDAGILNALLGGMLGGSLTLTLLDYQSLLSGRIDLFDLGAALSAREGLGGTLSDLTGRNARLYDLLRAMGDAAGSSAGVDGRAMAALAQIAAMKAGSSDTLAFGGLTAFGPYGTRDPGAAGTRPGDSASLLDLVAVALGLSRTGQRIEAALPVSIPGILSASVQFAVGERPVGAGYSTLGPAGASVHTAQTRLLITARLPGSGILPYLDLPLYLEIGTATATLASLTCNLADIASATATLDVQPGLADAWIGSVGPSDLANFSVSPSPGPATLLSVPFLLSVTARAHGSLGAPARTSLPFSYAEIRAVTKKTTSSQDLVATLLASTAGDLRVGVNVLGLGVPTTTGQTASQIVSGAQGPLDTLINLLLANLGVGLGSADAWVTGVRCGAAVLVN